MKTNRIAIRPENSLESILSLPCAVAALKSAYPDAEVGLVADDCHREAAALVPGLAFVENQVEGPWLKLFDLRERETAFHESTEWKSYTQSCTVLAQTNPYHRVDLWKKLVREDQRESNFELLPADLSGKTLPEELLDDSFLRIAVCTASLGIDELRVIVEGLSRVDVRARVFLLGTVPQRRKSTILVSAWQETMNLVDLCGKLCLSETAEAVRLCDIVITGPGSTALLSSGYGTFTVCVDQAGNPFHYPYGHGHLVVQPASSEQLQPVGALVTELVTFAVTGNGGTLPTLEQWRSFADMQVDNYLGRLRLLGTQRIETLLGDSGSFTELHLRPLIFLGCDIGDTSRAFYRLLWEHHLEGRTITTHELDLLQEDTVAQLCEELKPLQQLYELANFGRVYSSHVAKALAENNIEKAQAESARVQEVEDLLHQLAEAQAFLAPLCGFHARHQMLIPECTPVEMAHRMEQLFLSIQSRVTVLLDLARSLFHTTAHNETTLSEASDEGGSFHG